MADIVIEKAHSLGLQEAKRRLDAAVLARGAEFDLSGEWVSDTRFEFIATGAEGFALVSPNSLTVEVSLSFLARAFKGEIERKLREFIDEALATDPEKEKPTVIMKRRGKEESGDFVPALQPLGPRFLAQKKEPAPAPMSRREQIAVGAGVAGGAVVLVLTPGPLARLLVGTGAGVGVYLTVKKALRA